VPDSQFLILKGEFSTQIHKKTGLKERKGKTKRWELKGKEILKLA